MRDDAARKASFNVVYNEKGAGEGLAVLEITIHTLLRSHVERRLHIVTVEPGFRTVAPSVLRCLSWDVRLCIRDRKLLMR
jgi:hypothetical protein